MIVEDEHGNEYDLRDLDDDREPERFEVEGRLNLKGTGEFLGVRHHHGKPPTSEIRALGMDLRFDTPEESARFAAAAQVMAAQHHPRGAPAAVRGDVMTSTPQELYDALDARRREYSPRMPWWRVAVQMDVSLPQLHRLRAGANSPPVRRAARRWLEKTADQAGSRIREPAQTGQE